MRKLFITFCLVLTLFSSSLVAQEKSILGIDYLKVTKNQIIAEAMIKMEPALIEYYSKGKWSKATKDDRIYALRGLAIMLGRDRVSESNYRKIMEASPNIPLEFLKLDKSKYPNLWDFGVSTTLNPPLFAA